MTKPELLEEAIAELRAAQPEPDAVELSRARAWQRLAAAEEAVATLQTPEVLNSPEDYEALIPAYLAGTLSEARRLLVEDHARESVPFRKALERARRGEDVGVSSSWESEAPSSGRWRWALAAGLALTLAAVSWAWMQGVFSSPVERLVQVRAVQGDLVTMDDEAQRLQPGDWLAEGRPIRTTGASTALLRLRDGSEIEVAGRTALRFDERRGDTTIRVARGDIIVEAAEQKDGVLEVATADCLVTVKGTIFSVSSGTKGSLVGVVAGEVAVRRGRDLRQLSPGQMFASNTRLVAMPVGRQIAWSAHSAQYLELLDELRSLRRDLRQARLSDGLRYSTRLLDLAPAATTAFLSLPNPKTGMDEIERILQERMADSPRLREWWEQSLQGTEAESAARGVLDVVRQFADNLGDEIVLAALASADDFDGVALFTVIDGLAFDVDIERLAEEMDAESGNPAIELVVDPFGAREDDDTLLFWRSDDVVVAARSAALIRQAAAALAQGGGFPGTRLHGRLAEAYASGAEFLAGVDLGELVSSQLDEVPAEDLVVVEWSGLADVETAVLESKTLAEVTQLSADLRFAGERHGLAAWLAAPAPMGSLDFVSADAHAVSAALMRQPAEIARELVELIAARDDDFGAGWAEVQEHVGFDPIDDLAATLGGEIALAIDGPLVPSPSWKLILEVRDSGHLQATLAGLVERLSEEGELAASLSSENRDGRVYHHLTAGDGLGLVYTYEGPYLVAGPNAAVVDGALRVAESRVGITQSATFRELLPQDGFVNFSAVVFQDLGAMLEPLRGLLARRASAAGATPEEQTLLSGLAASDPSPGLYVAYGEPDAIRVAGTQRGSMLGGALDGLLGFGQMAGMADLMRVATAGQLQ